MFDSVNNNCVKIDWLKFAKIHRKDSLSFMTMNARSFGGKFAELLAYLHLLKSKITFILITETWFNSLNDVTYEIPGYKSESFCRANRKGGGLKLYCLDHMQYTVENCYTNESGGCESLFVTAVISGYGKVNICGIYRPPKAGIPEFFSYLETLLDRCGNQKSIFLGDYNINSSDDCENNTSLDYQSIFSSYGYQNEITLPTYVSPSTLSDKSCIDHIWHNLSLRSSSFILTPNISDHYAVSVIFETLINIRPYLKRYRDYSDANVKTFLKNCENEMRAFVMCPLDAQKNCKRYVSFLTRIMNRHFPIREKLLTCKRLKSPWITRSVLKYIRRKHKWRRMLKRNEITLRSYKKYCGALRHLLKTARAEHYQRKLKSLNDEPRRNWKILNNLMGKTSKSLSTYFKS